MSNMNEQNLPPEFDEESFDNIITLTGENGEEASFEFVDLIDYEGREFVVLIPMDEEDDGQVVILEVEEIEDSDEESYRSVEDEALLMKLFDIFKERFADVFDFE